MFLYLSRERLQAKTSMCWIAAIWWHWAARKWSPCSVLLPSLIYFPPTLNATVFFVFFFISLLLSGGFPHCDLPPPCLRLLQRSSCCSPEHHVSLVVVQQVQLVSEHTGWLGGLWKHLQCEGPPGAAAAGSALVRGFLSCRSGEDLPTLCVSLFLFSFLFPQESFHFFNWLWIWRWWYVCIRVCRRVMCWSIFVSDDV